MRPTLFLSDLHLAPDRGAANAAFAAFARGPARDAAAVYVLGDLFDVWLGDDQLRDAHAGAIADALADVARSGVAVHVQRGNRDFLLGERFAAAAGARLMAEQEVVDLAGQRVLLTHGDELCTDDVEYQDYRARMRSPEAVARLSRLPWSLRRLIGAYLRRRSRRANALKPEAIMDASASAVADAFRAHDVAAMIHGHTHRPARHRVDVDGRARERVVLADWRDRGHYLEVGPGGWLDRDVTG